MAAVLLLQQKPRNRGAVASCAGSPPMMAPLLLPLSKALPLAAPTLPVPLLLEDALVEKLQLWTALPRRDLGLPGQLRLQLAVALHTGVSGGALESLHVHLLQQPWKMCIGLADVSGACCS